jgi:predicted AAA+ superfamily ATPase
MAINNRDRVDRALIVVRDAIRGRCEEVWSAKYGSGWTNDVHSRDKAAQGLPDLDDVLFWTKGIQNTWMECWKNKSLPDAARNWVGELRDTRNAWAHSKNFSSDETYRVLDTAELLLQAFNAGEHIPLIQQMKSDLRVLVVTEQSRAEQRKVAAKATDGEPMKGLTPWREVITPHDDVATGRFEQAEFAADLHQVASGDADEEYQDPVKFFKRTFLTAGLSDLLRDAAARLAGMDGDPVIDLQSNFGGGKTHSMIALYHLASGVPVAEMGEVGALLEREKISLPKKISRAVLVGQMISASSPRLREPGVNTHTLWGELAYQLAGKEGYEIIRADDEAGTNPGERLLQVMNLAGPSIILIDEWVAYARQLPSKNDEARMKGGDFDTQFTFAQALTENAARCKNVVVLISIPASDIEVGGEKGREALSRLTNVVKRVSKQWAAATDDESFEIVRRRLFETISADNAKKRDVVINAFWDYYKQTSADFPSEVTEAEYKRRMQLSYPVHPELFDRLYRDWSTLERFQRTRGVLRLMAAVVSSLWQKGDQNLLIMPGNFPLDDAGVSAELLRYLEESWEPVVRTDVDGINSLPLKIDSEMKNLGRYSATRRVARAVFLASAPRDGQNPGVESNRVVLGAAQPGEAPGSFKDALGRLSSLATYVYVDGSRYWYSLKANINRLATERANSNFNDDSADDEIKRRLQSVRRSEPFAAVHVFPDGPGDVTDDDDGVHLVVLPPTHSHVPNTGDSAALKLAETILGQRSAGPRVNRNLLVFVAATEARLAEIRQAARTYLAWKSVEEDKDKLQLTPNDLKLAQTKMQDANATIEQRIFETFQSILVPSQQPASKEVIWDVAKTSGTGTLAERVAKKLESEEKLITRYSGTRVRMDLDKIPLWSENRDISVGELWKRYSQFPYLPRLANRGVLDHAVSAGVSNIDWSNETFAIADAFDDGVWKGLRAAEQVTTTPGMLLVHPEPALGQMAKSKPSGGTGATGDENGTGDSGGDGGTGTGEGKESGGEKAGEPRSYFATFELDRVRAIKQLESILQDIVDHLSKAPDASISLVLDINATSSGYSTATVRTVGENATTLGAKNSEFES